MRQHGCKAVRRYAANRSGARPIHVPRREEGSTLIEVLVALAILGLSLGVLLSTFSQSLSRTKESEHALAARQLARALLAAAETGPAPAIGRLDGEVPNGLTWQRDVAPFKQHDDDRARLRGETISVTVRWQNGAHALSLATLRLVPGTTGR